MTERTAYAEAFEAHRRFLLGLAYRMLGSYAEAEDAVQDAYLRWHAASGRGAIDKPRAFLAKTVTNLCLDRLKSARARREEYVGPWLPEPVVAEADLAVDDPASEFAHDLSVALLMTLERLSPLERAAFLLHDVFDMSFADIAAALDRSEAACRQLASRAREHVQRDKPRFQPPNDAQSRLVSAFAQAAQTGDVATLARLLAADAVLYSDGGGKVLAALNPIEGADHIIRFIMGISAKFGLPPQATWRAAIVNAMPGFVFSGPDGAIQTVAFEVSEDDLIRAIYIVRNPDKLRHLH